VLSLTVGGLLTIAAAVPAHAAASTTAGSTVPRALEAQAAKSYAAFRHPKRRADALDLVVKVAIG
jgi:hypothetical protein